MLEVERAWAKSQEFRRAWDEFDDTRALKKMKRKLFRAVQFAQLIQKLLEKARDAKVGPNEALQLQVWTYTDVILGVYHAAQGTAEAYTQAMTSFALAYTRASIAERWLKRYRTHVLLTSHTSRQRLFKRKSSYKKVKLASSDTPGTDAASSALVESKITVVPGKDKPMAERKSKAKQLGDVAKKEKPPRKRRHRPPERKHVSSWDKLAGLYAWVRSVVSPQLRYSAYRVGQSILLAHEGHGLASFANDDKWLTSGLKELEHVLGKEKLINITQQVEFAFPVNHAMSQQEQLDDHSHRLMWRGRKLVIKDMYLHALISKARQADSKAEHREQEDFRVADPQLKAWLEADTLAEQLYNSIVYIAQHVDMMEGAGAEDEEQSDLRALESIKALTAYRLAQRKVRRNLAFADRVEELIQHGEKFEGKKATWKIVFKFLDRAQQSTRLLMSLSVLRKHPVLLQRAEKDLDLIQALKRRAVAQGLLLKGEKVEYEMELQQARHIAQEILIFRKNAPYDGIEVDDRLIEDWRYEISKVLDQDVSESDLAAEESEDESEEESSSEEDESGTGVGSRISGFFGSIWGTRTN